MTDDPNRPNVVPDPEPQPVAELVRVDQDELVVREDLGPDTYTLIPAGHVVPKALEGLPRQQGKAQARRKR